MWVFCVLKEQPAHDLKTISYNPHSLLDLVQISRFIFCKLRNYKHKHFPFFRLYGTNWLSICSYFNLQETPLSSITSRKTKGILFVTDSNNF